MKRVAGLLLLPLLVLVGAGCQSTGGPIFPAIFPAKQWPSPPDQPRIRYIGELTGQASLGAKPQGWDAVRAVLTGPAPQAVFLRPSAVAVAGDRVYVADIGAAVVHMLNLATRAYSFISGPPNSSFQVPIDMAILPSGELLVVDRARTSLDVFGLDGAFRRSLTFSQLAAPVAAEWDAQRNLLWIVDAKAHALFTWRPGSAGALTTVVQGRGGEPGQLNFPSDVAAHPQLGAIVADAMNFRLQAIDQTGQPRLAVGQKGDAAGDFARPRSVAVDSDGNIHVVDNQFENVQMFDAAGRLLMAYGRGGTGRGELSLPAGIWIDAQARIWIADGYNRRVQVFQYLGGGVAEEDAS